MLAGNVLTCWPGGNEPDTEYGAFQSLCEPPHSVIGVNFELLEGDDPVVGVLIGE